MIYRKKSQFIHYFWSTQLLQFKKKIIQKIDLLIFRTSYGISIETGVDT